MCSAPLALAGTLLADLVARGAVAPLEARVPGHEMKDSGDSYKSYKDYKYGGIDEVLIIWVNSGGGAATSVVTDTVTITAAGAAAAATHSVSQLTPMEPEGQYTDSIKGHGRWLSRTRLHARYDRSNGG